MKILIVDDSRSSRLMIKTCLKEITGEIFEADGAESAVEIFKRGEIELVIMDIHMPKIDGYQATRRIRAVEMAAEKKPIPIIALTAMDAAQAAPRTKLAGANECLTKPVKQADLLKAISRCMPDGTVTTSAVQPPASEPAKESSGWFGKIRGKGKDDLDGIAQAALQGDRADFLLEKQGELEQAMLAVEGASFDTALLLAHRLKGEGANFGFKEISDLGAELATAALNKDFASARAALKKLLETLRKAGKDVGLVELRR